MQIVQGSHIDNSSLTLSKGGGLNHATSVAISGSGTYAYVTAFNANRVTPIDVTNPSAPIVNTPLSDATHLPAPADLAVQGNYLYVANQSSSNEFTVLDVSNPASPKWVASITSPLLSGAYRIHVKGDFAYVSASSASTVAAIDISDPTHPRIAGAVTDPALSITTGLDVDATGTYVIATSPRQSTETNVKFPPYPGSMGGPMNTGTISEIQLDPSPISVAITSQPTNPTTQTSASFSFSASDDVAAFQCKIDGGSFGLCSGSATQTLTQAYSGLSPGTHTFTVQATDAAGRTNTDSYTWTIGTVAATAPLNTSPPTVPAAATQGQTLTASAGQWSGSPTPTFAYQWLRCNQSGQGCQSISGSTGASYSVQSADVGSTLAVAVTARNSAGSSSAQSKPTAVVPATLAAPHNSALPVISGTAKAGAKLTATNGSWSGNPAPTFSDRWERCDSHGNHCTTISGQTHATYTIATSDIGFTLRIVVTATNSQGSSSATSAQTAVVASAKAAGVASIRRTALTGLSEGKPKLQITLAGGANDALLNRLTIVMPKGLSFSTSKRSLSKGITVTRPFGARASFTAKIVRGSLVLTLRRATVSLRVQIQGAALKLSKQFALNVRKKHVQTLKLTVTLAGKSARTVHTVLKLKVT